MKKIVGILYIAFIFLLMADGAKMWFLWFWYNPDLIIIKRAFMVLGSLICIEYCNINTIKLKRDRNTIIGLLLLYINLLCESRFSFNSFFYKALYIFPLWVLISDVNKCEIVLKVTINIMACILIPGLILHLYMLNNGLLPGVPIVFPTNSTYLFLNYGFVLKGIGMYEADGIRFQSVFLEPGYCAQFLVFLLYAIRFDFKKYKLAFVLVLGVITSLSLAGYVLIILGFGLCQWSKYIRLTKYFMLLFIFSFVVSFVISYYGNNTVFSNKILDRLVFDKEKGVIGNNRTGDGADFYFEQSIRDGSFLFGIGNERIEQINGGSRWEDVLDYANQIRGAGYKVYILQNGIISIIFFLLSYYKLMYVNRKNIRYSLGFFILIVATFVQASYPSSYSWLAPFVFGISSFSSITPKQQYSNLNYNLKSSFV